MSESVNESSPSTTGSTTTTGGCACGAVTYTIQFKNDDAVVNGDTVKTASICHCTMCSAWSGGIFTYIEIYPHEGTVTFCDGSENQQWLGVWKSSEFGERGFCKMCGSSLFCRVTMSGPMQGVYHIGAGTLTHPTLSVAAANDGGGGTTSTHPIQTIQDQFFVDRKSCAYTFPSTGKHMTSTEFFAMWE